MAIPFISRNINKVCLACDKEFINAVHVDTIEDRTSTGKEDNLTVWACPYCGSRRWNWK